MSATSMEPAGRSDHRQGRAGIRLLAAILGVLPVYLGLIILQLLSDQQISVREFTLYLAVIAPLSIVIVLLLLRFVCREDPRALNLRPGRMSTDLLAALILSLVMIVANVISNFLLSQLLPESGSDTSIRNLFTELAGDPKLLILFVGPLIFLGAASEEVVRVFFLSRLYKVWPSSTGRLLVVILSACLFGLIHIYRGPVGATWTAIYGLIAALYYLRFGRVVPLILAHYITNALQVVVFALLAK